MSTPGDKIRALPTAGERTLSLEVQAAMKRQEEDFQLLDNVKKLAESRGLCLMQVDFDKDSRIAASVWQTLPPKP